MPIPTAVLDDGGFPIWEELRPALSEAVAAKLDAPVFARTEKPASWPEAIMPAAEAAGHVVSPGATAAQGGTLDDLAQLLDMVEGDGYDASAIVADRALRGLLRRSRDMTRNLACGRFGSSVDAEHSPLNVWTFGLVGRWRRHRSTGVFGRPSKS